MEQIKPTVVWVLLQVSLKYSKVIFLVGNTLKKPRAKMKQPTNQKSSIFNNYIVGAHTGITILRLLWCKVV